METQRCTTCGKVKPTDEFIRSISGDRKTIHYRTTCHHCHEKSMEYSSKRKVSDYMWRNKECSLYLGVVIAEGVLSKVFTNAIQMPFGNAGYDFICGKGYKVDVKSSTRQGKNRNSWIFTIKYNNEADYFLLLAFNNRSELEPEHIWLIPANVLSDKSGVSISERTLSKWSEYELTDKLDQVIACCDEMKFQKL